MNAAMQARRRLSLGGTDMKILMDGDPLKIHRLWAEKTGVLLPEDLTWVWPVRRGQATESINIDFFEHNQNMTVSRRGEVARHAFLPWATVTLDGWIDQLECPIECKDVGGREVLSVVIMRYQPQMQFQMEVTGADQVALSLIIGGNEPVIEWIERDAAYAAEMIKVGEAFWGHVQANTPPVDLPTVPPPVVAEKIYDMIGNNAWGNSASVWIETREAADDHDAAAKVLKALVPADAKQCHGHGVYINRNRAGSLSLREGTGK